MIIITVRHTIDVLFVTVVVIGFERNAYVVFEGQGIEVCVAVLARNLSNDEDRQFTVATSQLANDAATGMYPLLVYWYVCWYVYWYTGMYADMYTGILVCMLVCYWYVSIWYVSISFVQNGVLTLSKS